MDKAPMPPKGNIDLYNKAVEEHKRVFKKAIWNGEKYKKKTGHMLQSLFGKKVWTLKDLDDRQLKIIIDICSKKPV